MEEKPNGLTSVGLVTPLDALRESRHTGYFLCPSNNLSGNAWNKRLWRSGLENDRLPESIIKFDDALEREEGISVGGGRLKWEMGN